MDNARLPEGEIEALGKAGSCLGRQPACTGVRRSPGLWLPLRFLPLTPGQGCWREQIPPRPTLVSESEGEREKDRPEETVRGDLDRPTAYSFGPRSL